MLNLPQTSGGWGSEPNSQWTNTGVKQQRVRVGAVPQANLPEEWLTFSRDWERNKDWERGVGWQIILTEDLPTLRRDWKSTKAGGGSDKLISQSRAKWWWIPELISGTEGSIQNWIAPCICHLVETTTLTTLHELAVLPYLTIPTNLVDKRNKYYSQA
jgi:hypothetical protein